MDQTAILERVRGVFRAALDEEHLAVDITTRKNDLKAWDSLAHVRLISGIESEFDIQLGLKEIEEIGSVRQFVETIQKHLQ
jgi:acyl carrier protein